MKKCSFQLAFRLLICLLVGFCVETGFCRIITRSVNQNSDLFNHGIYQIVSKDEENIRLIYFLNNSSRVDLMPDEMYSFLDAERGGAITGDFRYRMSIWNYNLKSNTYTPSLNRYNKLPVVYRYDQGGNTLAEFNYQTFDLSIYREKKMVFRQNLFDYFYPGKPRNRAKPILMPLPSGSNFKPSNYFYHTYPISVGQDSAVSAIYDEEGNNLRYLLETNFKTRQTKSFDLSKLIYSFFGISLVNNSYCLFNDNQVLIMDSGKNSEILRTLPKGEVKDVLEHGKQIFVLIGQFDTKTNDSFKNNLYIRNSKTAKFSLFMPDLFGVYISNGYLIIFQNIRNEKLCMLVYDQNLNVTAEKKIPKKEYFPIVMRKDSRLVLFNSQKREKPLIIDMKGKWKI